MSGRDQDVLGRDTRFMAGLGADRTGEDRRHADQIAEDEGRLLFVLVKIYRLGMERVVHSGAEPLIEIAAHAVANWRGNVRHGHTHLQLGRLQRGRSRGNERNPNKKKKPARFHKRTLTTNLRG